jgi:hypothetical protein
MPTQQHIPPAKRNQPTNHPPKIQKSTKNPKHIAAASNIQQHHATQKIPRRYLTPTNSQKSIIHQPQLASNIPSPRLHRRRRRPVMMMVVVAVMMVCIFAVMSVVAALEGLEEHACVEETVCTIESVIRLTQLNE